jgi:hypothetical protein
VVNRLRDGGVDPTDLAGLSAVADQLRHIYRSALTTGARVPLLVGAAVLGLAALTSRSIPRRSPSLDGASAEAVDAAVAQEAFEPVNAEPVAVFGRDGHRADSGSQLSGDQKTSL